MIRNTTLPGRTRAQAQLQLSQMHCYTRFTQINNRCIEGGKSRGVLKDFRMARVSPFPDEELVSKTLIMRAVSFQNECSGREFTGRQKGKLVMDLSDEDDVVHM